MRIKSKFVLIITLLLTTLSQDLKAQTRGFSREPEIFIKELGVFVKKNKDKTIDATFDVLQGRWDEGVYSEDQQSFIMRTSEFMMLKKFKVNPDFQLFMKTIIAASDSTVSPELFDNWIQQSYSLLKKSKRSYLKLLQTSYHIFNEQALYVDKSKKWVFTTNDYKFVLKKKSVKIILGATDLHCKGPEDEIIIFNTSGVYDVLKNEWEGTKGSLNWERVKLPATSTFASFNAYKLDLTKGEIQIDTALFKYNGIFS